MVKIKEKLKNKANPRRWQPPALATPGVVAKAVIAALIVVGFLGGITWAAGGWGFGSGSSSTTDVSVGTSADKGLIGYWPLDSASEKVGSELVMNEDMELDSNWSSYNSPTTNEQSNEQVYTGTYSRKFIADALNEGIRSENFSVIAGKKYRVTAWIYSVNKSWATLRVRHGDGTGFAYNYANTVTNGEWTLIKADYTETISGSNAYIHFDSGGYSSGTWYVDNVSIKEIKTADATPYSHHGTVYGATQNDDDMTFDGTDDYINAGTADMNTDELTISFWVYSEDAGDQDHHIISNADNTGWYQPNGFDIGDGWTAGYYFYYSYIGNAHIQQHPSHMIGVWSHITFVYAKGDYMKGYINGDYFAQSASVGTETINAANTLYIGRAIRSGKFKGKLKDVRIYNRALSDTEVASLYNGGKSASKNLVIGSKSKGLVGEWKLDQASEKVGDEMHSNFDMESGITSWTFDSKTNGSRDSYTADFKFGLKSVRIKNSTVGPIAFWQAKSASVGELYKVVVWAKNIDSPTIPYFSSAGATFVSGDTSFVDISTTEWQKYEGIFKATDTTINIYIRTAANATQGYFLVDNYSLKQIYTKDATPYSNNGAIYGATYTTDRQGQANKAMSFDGVDDYINAGNISQTNFGTGDFSISAWINTTDSQFYILGKQTWGVAEGFFLGTKAGYDGGDDNYFWFDTGYSSANAKILTSLINTGQWVHVVAIRSNGVGYIYVNNALEVTDSSNSQNVDSNASLTIGRRTGSGYYLDGDLSDVRIYDRALSAEEIASLYNSYNPIISTGSLQKGLVLDMPLDSKREKVGGETITNGDAEIGDVTGWSVQGGASRSSVISQLHSGTYSLQVTNSNTSGGLPYNFIYQQVNGLTIGATYRTVAWVKGATSSDTGYIGVSDDIVQGEASYYGSDGGPNHSDWTKLSVTFVPEATTVYVQLYSNSGANISYWDDISLKEIQTADTTTYSNHGVVYGATQNSDSMSFDGSTNYIVTSKNNIENTFTFSAWINGDTSFDGQILGRLNTTWSSSSVGDFIYYAGTSAWGLYGFLGSGVNGGANSYLISNSLSPNTWYHLVATYDGTTIKYYKDGVDINDDKAMLFSDDASSLNIWIGARQYSGSMAHFEGDIANVKIYNRALSADEVQLLYNKGR
ncbi:MAG: LamG-like jellyroll fold domain-containing protein [Candidatus Komeilibacteria bacterium]